MEIAQFEIINNHKLATAFHDSGSKNIIIFCHGFRSSSIGPNRTFVNTARLLEKEGISSLRFDQYGSGNSEGDFIDSSFEDWVATTKALVEKYYTDGYKVALLGQSMGGSTVLVVGSHMQDKLASIVAWVPDASIDAPQIQGTYMEEGGQRVKWNFWQEAHAAHIVDCFQHTKIPEYIFIATHDQFVSKENQDALRNSAQSNQEIELLQGHTHSSWSYDQATYVIHKTVSFFKKHF